MAMAASTAAKMGSGELTLEDFLDRYGDTGEDDVRARAAEGGGEVGVMAVPETKLAKEIAAEHVLVACADPDGTRTPRTSSGVVMVAPSDRPSQ